MGEQTVEWEWCCQTCVNVNFQDPSNLKYSKSHSRHCQTCDREAKEEQLKEGCIFWRPFGEKSIGIISAKAPRLSLEAFTLYNKWHWGCPRCKIYYPVSVMQCSCTFTRRKRNDEERQVKWREGSYPYIEK